MMHIPPAIADLPIAALYLFMTRKKETFKAMQAQLEGQSMKDGSASASIPACEDAPFEPQPLKHHKQSTAGASPGEAETRPKKTKKEGATEHSWPVTVNERRLTTALEEMDLEQLKQAVAATMPDVQVTALPGGPGL